MRIPVPRHRNVPYKDKLTLARAFSTSALRVNWTTSTTSRVLSGEVTLIMDGTADLDCEDIVSRDIFEVT